MTKFRELGGSMKNLRPLKEPTKITSTIKTSKGEVEFIPTFNKGEIVTVKPNHVNRDSSLKKLKDLVILVDYCKVADLGNMVVEVLYLQKTNKAIQNPYLVEHFESLNI